MRVLLTWQASSEEIESIQNRLPSVTEVVAAPARSRLSHFDADVADLVMLGRQADAFLGWVMPRDAIVEATRLEFISYCSAGVDHLPLDLLRERNIRLANATGVYAVPVAEHAFTLLLASAKRLIADHQAAVELRWQPRRQPPFVSAELTGKTVAIIGVGAIGSHVARFAKAFGMYVVGVTRSGTAGNGVADEIVGIESLHRVLGRADYVVLCLPLTKETRWLMNDEAFLAMRSDAHLINVARGDIVDETAVHRALIENRIAGFATDTWWDYSKAVPSERHFPLPTRLGVNRLPNVIATGDRAANTVEGVSRSLDLATTNLAAFLSGRQPAHLVDLDLGY